MFKCVVSKPGKRRSFGRQPRLINRSSPEKSGNRRNSVKVVVRTRPENERELLNNHRTVVQVIDDKMLIFDPVEATDEFYFHGQKHAYRDLLKKQNKDLKFMFDQVFDGAASNAQVFEHTTKGLLDPLLDGFNCSVFAYGATGSGKTFTMLGSQSHPGIIFMTVMELYRKMEDLKDQKEISVTVSYLEIYNETIRDLLTPSSGLQVREDPMRGVVISGLSSHMPKSAEELLNMIHFGNSNRTQHPTDANAESSRSHAIFQVYVRQQDRTSGLSSKVRLAKMSLIDLAGSERASVVSKCNERFREGANINKSLLALGNCINALADKKNKNHIPYRNSKLTHILKDSLGGNCYTVMIAAVSPSSLSYEDTYNTLKYADRAKTIQISLKKNIQSVDAHISNYAKIVEKLQKENAELKAKLQIYAELEEDQMAAPTSCTCEHPSGDDVPSIDEAVSQIEQLFSKNKLLRINVLEHESSIRQLEIQVHFRKAQLEHFSAINKEGASLQKSTAKTDHAVRALEERCQSLVARKDELKNALDNNVKEIEALKVKLPTQYEGTPLKLLNVLLKKEELEAEKVEANAFMTHVQRVSIALEKENITTERLLVSSLKLNRVQQMILSEQELLSSDLKEDFNNLMKHSQYRKEVTWADETPPINPVTYQHFFQIPLMNATACSGKASVDAAGCNEIQMASSSKLYSLGRIPSILVMSPKVRRSLNNLFESNCLTSAAPSIADQLNGPSPGCQPYEEFQSKTFYVSPINAKLMLNMTSTGSGVTPCSTETVADTPEHAFNRTFGIGDGIPGTSSHPLAIRSTAADAFRDLPDLRLTRSKKTPTPPRPQMDILKRARTVASSPDLRLTRSKKTLTPPRPQMDVLKRARTVASSPELPKINCALLTTNTRKDPADVARISCTCLNGPALTTLSPSEDLPETSKVNDSLLNTSFTIAHGSRNAAESVPISCDDVTSTTFANKGVSPACATFGLDVMEETRNVGTFSSLNSTFRVLTPQNGMKRSNRFLRESVSKKYRTTASPFSSNAPFRGPASSKPYMAMTASASVKIRSSRHLSIAKENLAPYVLAGHPSRPRIRTADSHPASKRMKWK